MTMVKGILSALALVAGLASVAIAPANAAVVVYDDLAAWKAAAGTWTETTNLGVSVGSIVSGATLADGTTLGFAENLHVQAIGSGWSTWCCGYTGQVLASYNTGGWLTEHWTISAVGGFGMFIEPNPFSVQAITMTTSSGEFITQNVDGIGGAAFFGWVGSGVTGLTISSTADFATGDWFTTAATEVPEPFTLSLFSAGLAGAVAMRRRKQGKRA